MNEQKLKQTYTLECSLCTRPYQSREGFPKPQFCQKCTTLIKEAGWKSPDEIKLMFNPDYLDFQKGVEVTRELYKGYVKLADDQKMDMSFILNSGSTIPLHFRIWEAAIKQGFRKVELEAKQ